jgi:hypothetical protein
MLYYPRVCHTRFIDYQRDIGVCSWSEIRFWCGERNKEWNGKKQCVHEDDRLLHIVFQRCVLRALITLMMALVYISEMSVYSNEAKWHCHWLSSSYSLPWEPEFSKYICDSQIVIHTLLVRHCLVQIRDFLKNSLRPRRTWESRPFSYYFNVTICKCNIRNKISFKILLQCIALDIFWNTNVDNLLTKYTY